MSKILLTVYIPTIERLPKNGYEAVSVSQIARTFGMTKEALYRHYENKL
ncbi:MAG: helix-turn-helix transcriptional regulator [Roseburia sp.]|nr:helix-turn-helix transcriptional regulator [Roseburia sp.]